MKFDRILIVDFGSQYTLLIAKAVRKLRVYSEVVQPQHLSTYLSSENGEHVYGIILSGGPHSVNQDHKSVVRELIEKSKMPVLGICYGAQILASLVGAIVKTTEAGEYGYHKLELSEDNDPLHLNIPEEYTVWQSHSDSIFVVGEVNPFKIISKRGDKIESFKYHRRPIWGLQYHPEVSHTPIGPNIFDNFLRQCKVPREWSTSHFVEMIIPELQSQLESNTKEKVMVACSGGVDSTVTAALIQRAVGDRMMGIFVDPGILRLGEYNSVLKGYRRMGLNVIGIDASSRFLDALKGNPDPEKKRKIIGNLFIEIFKEHAPNATWLGQGTIYPDVIESEGGIKSHHNVGGLPEKLNLQLVEPLRYLFKDDVRELGDILGVDPIILNRHPFPGPGLAIRILGEVTKDKVDILQRADAIYMDLLKRRNYYKNIWQAGAILLDSKSVGVQGDNRTYQWVVALRAVESVNGMTASVYPFPMSFLTEVSTEIINQVPEINRVTYDITTKPPGTIEWE